MGTDHWLSGWGARHDRVGHAIHRTDQHAGRNEILRTFLFTEGSHDADDGHHALPQDLSLVVDEGRTDHEE